MRNNLTIYPINLRDYQQILGQENQQRLGELDGRKQGVSTLPIPTGDRQQCLAQLRTLGYGPGDRVYVRLLIPKKTPDKVKLLKGMAWDKDGKIIPIPIDAYLTLTDDGFIATKIKRDESGKFRDSKTYQDGFGYLTDLNIKGYGVYFVVNPGGREDNDITHCHSLFYECDRISKDEQWTRLQTLEKKIGSQVALVVETRNSLHCYPRTVETLEPETWEQYQQRLIQEQDSDPSIYNEARLMRLAGFDHWQWNEETQKLEATPVKIVQLCDTKIPIAELDLVLPPWDSERWGKQTNQDYSTPSNPIDNPWDIRNFTQYLEGGSTRRRGWRTYKCPNHNGVSDDSLHIENNTGAFKCHAGCDSKAVYEAALNLAKTAGHQFPEGKRQRKAKDPIQFFAQKFKKAKQVFNAYGFAKRGDQALGITPVEKRHQSEEPGVTYYDMVKPNDRLKAWKSALSHHKYVLDCSATGDGKSYDAGRFSPTWTDGETVIYGTHDAWNPTTKTVENLPQLKARHWGMVIKPRIVRTKHPNDDFNIPANCGRAYTESRLRNKGYSYHDVSICANCPFQDECAAGTEGYNYLFQRAETLKKHHYRANLASLPPAEDFDYSKTTFVIDEHESISLKETRSISKQDFEALVVSLIELAPEELKIIQPLIKELKQYLVDGESVGTFGIRPKELLEKLPNIEEITDEFIEKIELLTTPSMDWVNNEEAHEGVHVADLPSKLQKRFITDDATLAKIAEDMPATWFPQFLRIITRKEPGAVHLSRSESGHNTLVLTIQDYKAQDIFQASKGILLLDATISREDAAVKMGCSLDELHVIKARSEQVNNIQFIQIAGLGSIGKFNRSKDKQRRIDAIHKAIKAKHPDQKIAFFDFKWNHAHNAEILGDNALLGAHWRDSRGSNQYQEAEILVCDGVPTRNLIEMEAEFTLIYGRTPNTGSEKVKRELQLTKLMSSDKGLNNIQPYFEREESADPEFREFVRKRQIEDINQLIGRLRANRRPGTQFIVYLLGDYAWPFPVELIKAQDFTPEAGDRVQIVEQAIKQAVQQLLSQGKRVTQKAVADIVGVTQGYISRFRELLLSLLDPLYRVSNNLLEENETNDVAVDATVSALEEVASSPPGITSETLEEVFFEWLTPTDWPKLWEKLSINTQIQVLRSLLIALPDQLYRLKVAL